MAFKRCAIACAEDQLSTSN